MPFNPIDAISLEERLKFSQNFGVVRPTVLDKIFPDTKTAYWKAEYYRLMNGSSIPDVAFVHALDTEAEIGTRPAFEKVLAEKLFIKRKINQSESLQQAIEHGVPDDDALIKYVFDDATNLFEGVLARTKIMKGQALSKGKMVINENNVNMTVDFHVPEENKKSLSNWSLASADILGDIQAMIDVASEKGYVPNTLVTSGKNIGYMRNNTAIQVAILGATNARLVSKIELANFIMREFGLVIERCDEKFRYKQADGNFATGRYFAEDSVSIFEADMSGSFGTGLWGTTPEENEYRQFIEQTNQSFITLSMWATPDPVAKWTKASGMFIPVMPKANGLVIGTVGK